MRIAILTAESPQGNLITTRLVRRHAGAVCGIVSAVGVERGRSLVRSIARLGRRVAPTFLAWKVGERAATEVAWRWLRWSGRRPAIPRLAALAREAGVPLVATRDVNDDATLARLRAWRPDLAVSVHFTHRLGPAALALPTAGALNVHGAWLPKNRGLFPYFWALANGDATGGVSVHWVDAGLDTGDLVAQRAVPIDDADTVSVLSWKGAEVGGALLDEVLVTLRAGRPLPRRPQVAADATYHSWPAPADVAALRARGRRFGSLVDTWRRVVGATAAGSLDGRPPTA